MTVNRHGLSIGIERVDSDLYLTLKAVGTLQHSDYEVIVPMIDSALAGVKDAKVKVFFDGTELDGWELRAAWDDLKLGLKYGHEFKKVAILGNKRWLEMSAKIGSWFVTGDIKYFENENENETEAFDWLHE
jgi:hypothetical protein